MGIFTSSFWNDNFRLADHYYEEWSDRFKCDKLEEYYENFQHQIQGGAQFISQPYTVNMIYATIETKLANMLLTDPEFETEVRPQFVDWDQETAFESGEIKQDTINTLIQNPNVHFVDTLKMAALDYFFRFSAIEVGYAADWQNPNKLPPKMKSRLLYKDLGDKDKPVEDFEVPVDERLYFYHIPARRFRVAAADSSFLGRCSWAGYYSYYYRDLLEHIKSIKFPEQLKELQNPVYSPDYAGPTRIVGSSAKDDKESEEIQYLHRRQEILKVWTIYDNRNHAKLLIHEDGHVMFEQDWARVTDSIATHRSNYRLKGWYPIPPVWYWISPQNEINEAREQLRNYRRRFKRKFWYLQNKVKSTELDKLASDIDGEAIEVKEREAIGGISNPEVGTSIQAGLELAYSDFNFVSGSSQARESDRETATKSKIIALKEQVRENVERISFDKFVCDVGRLGLLVASYSFSEPMWIRYTTHPSEQFLGEVQASGPAYRQIFATQLDDGYDFTLKLRVKNASASQTEEEMQKFVAFMSLINQFPQLMFSPYGIREAAIKTGYRNERMIKEMQQAALLQQMSQMAMMQQQLGGMSGGNQNGAGSANNAARNAIENRAPNPTNEINNQLQRQV